MRLDALPPLREVIRAHGLDARKSLGQHFLLDLNLTAKIARAAGDLAGATVFEVGPGPGGLTRALLATDAAEVVAIERDPRAVAALGSLVAAAEGRLALIAADALAVDLAALRPPPRAVVANLPYNIATPLLIGWLEAARAFRSMTLMFQAEVAERLAAAPGSKAYGRLSVIAQWRCEVRVLLNLPAAAFTPPPKVASSVVRLVPRDLPADTPPFASMGRVTAAAFGQRRKMLRQSLKPLARDPERLLDAAGLDPTARAEDVPVNGFERLASALDRASPPAG